MISMNYNFQQRNASSAKIVSVSRRAFIYSESGKATILQSQGDICTVTVFKSPVTEPMGTLFCLIENLVTGTMQTMCISFFFLFQEVNFCTLLLKRIDIKQNRIFEI